VSHGDKNLYCSGTTTQNDRSIWIPGIRTVGKPPIVVVILPSIYHEEETALQTLNDNDYGVLDYFYAPRRMRSDQCSLKKPVALAIIRGLHCDCFWQHSFLSSPLGNQDGIK